MPGKGRVPCSGQGRVPLVEQDECAVWTSELGKSFWRNVRLGNIQCEFDEGLRVGFGRLMKKKTEHCSRGLTIRGQVQSRLTAISQNLVSSA